MSKTIKGVVGYVSPGKEYRGSTLYSFKLDGNDTWFGCGETAPEFSAGDMVKFEYIEANGRYTVDMENVMVKKGEAPKAAPKPAGKAWAGKKDPAKDQYWADKEAKDDTRQKSITYQSARKDALEFLTILLSAEGLSLPKVQNKKMDALLAMTDELTARFYDSTMNLSAIKTDKVPAQEEEEPTIEADDGDFNDQWDD